MKFIFCLAAALLFFSTALRAQTTNALTPAQIQFRELVQKIQDKAQAGKNSEADFADELKQFDTLIASQPATNREDTAHLTFMKGILYVEVLGNLDKSGEILRQLTKDFPGTKSANLAEDALAQIASLQARIKMQDEILKQEMAGLPAGTPLAPFDEKDLDGKTLSLAALKGKVVLVDFWATWCPPCVQEVPNVIAAYQKHHTEGFEVVGVSGDEDVDELKNFLKKHDGMSWPQYFDGRRLNNKLAIKYGVKMIPFTILLDRDGKIIGADLRGEKLEPAVIAALAKK